MPRSSCASAPNLRGITPKSGVPWGVYDLTTNPVAIRDCGWRAAILMAHVPGLIEYTDRDDIRSKKKARESDRLRSFVWMTGRYMPIIPVT
jgi:hypothetical protein